MPSIDVARQNGNPTFNSVTVGNITASYVTVGSTNPNLILQNQTSGIGSATSLTFRGTLGTGATGFVGYINGVMQSSTSNTGDLSFNVYNNGIVNEGIRINSSGSVGIGGISTPIRTLDVNGNQALQNQSVFTYRFYKSFTENTTGVNFFSVTLQASYAASVYVYLGSTNSQTGAFLSQIYQFIGGAYFGGWTGTGNQVSITPVVGLGASQINNASINGSGVITFTCSTSNNGTGTTNDTWAYIIVSSNYTQSNPSATVL
jgi:hypothetical protein